MDDIYKNIEECNPNKKCKILIVYYENSKQTRTSKIASKNYFMKSL